MRIVAHCVTARLMDIYPPSAEYVKYVKRAAQKKMGVATDVDRKEDEKNGRMKERYY